MTYIPSPNFYAGRRSPLKWVVWHSTEGNETQGAARSLAQNWFGKSSSGVSAHIIADNIEVVECVKPENTAWHAANGNASGYGIEIIGKAGQTSVQWGDPYSLASIRNACGWVKNHPALKGITARWLSDAQLRAGATGHITHYQVSRVLGGTTHTDPGVNFPYQYVMSQLGSSLSVPLTPQPLPVPGLPTLRYGMMGDAGVKRLQEFMTRVFPSYNKYTPTGNYLDQTAAGILQFQHNAGVRNADGSMPDGRIVGERTNAALVRFGYRG